MKHIAFAATALALLAGNAEISVAQAKQKFIEIRIAGATNVDANDINDNGDVAGSYTDSSGASHGFLRAADGTITTFDVPGASTFAVSINSSGEIAGYSSLNQAFVREPDGTITSFGVMGATQTTAVAINKNGIVAGRYMNPSFFAYGFVRQANGKIQTFDPDDSIGVVTSGINSHGIVVGYSSGQFGWTTGFIRTRDGTISDLSIGQTVTNASAINSAGWIAGTANPGGGPLVGFLRDPEGNYTTFDSPDGAGVTVTGLNDRNWVLGFFTDSFSRAYSGFVRVPDGTIIDVNDPRAGDYGTYLSAINKAGMVLGGYQDTSSLEIHSFIVRVKP